MKKAAKICSFFICRFKFFILNLHTCPGNPGTVPTTLSRGGEFLSASYRLPLSRQCFFMPVCLQTILRGFWPKSAAGRQGVPRKFGTKNPERANKAADATGFIVIFASGFFNAYT